MAANHYLIHLTLLLSEPICMSYWQKYQCHNGYLKGDDGRHLTYDHIEGVADKGFYLTQGEKYSFLGTHLYCFLASVLAICLEYFRLNEIGKLFEISRIPVYIYQLYYAHYYLLNYGAKADGFDIDCGPENFDLTKIWMLIEIIIFYSYIVSGIFFYLLLKYQKST